MSHNKMLVLASLTLLASISGMLMMVYGAAGIEYMLTNGSNFHPMIISPDVMLLALIGLIASCMALGLVIGKWVK